MRNLLWGAALLLRTLLWGDHCGGRWFGRRIRHPRRDLDPTKLSEPNTITATFRTPLRKLHPTVISASSRLQSIDQPVIAP